MLQAVAAPSVHDSGQAHNGVWLGTCIEYTMWPLDQFAPATASPVCNLSISACWSAGIVMKTDSHHCWQHAGCACKCCLLTFQDLQPTARWYIEQPEGCPHVHRLLVVQQFTLVWLQGRFELGAGCLQRICQGLHGCNLADMLLLCMRAQDVCRMSADTLATSQSVSGVS